MSRLGFELRWICLIIKCISSISYSVMINRAPYGHIHPSCGIRQGDPLSPYLFIMCAEALSGLLQQAERTRVISGVPIARGRVRLNHLLFADDSLLFYKATIPEWARLHLVLKKYEQAFGQRLNPNKTSIFFSQNTLVSIRLQILSAAGVQPSNSFEKYLSLPALVGQSKQQAFLPIKETIWNRISNWKTKFLSQAGKEILLKAVA